MKIMQVPFHMITYTATSYKDSLKQSLLRMGQGFPILVKKTDTGYLCLDGHKRLSAMKDILQEQPMSKFTSVKIILNTARSTSGTTKNHH